MQPDKPPDSSTFDALWDADGDAADSGGDGGDDDLPPALAPSRLSTRGAAPPNPQSTMGALPPYPQQAEPLVEERATVAPPVPPDEYVRAMMDLGELDDPMPPPGAVFRDGGPRPRSPGKALGLVLAPESEFEPWRDDPLPTPRARFPRVPAPPLLGPRDDRAPTLSHLPIPRAPSAPPPLVDPHADTVNALDAFGALEGLGSLDALDLMPFDEILPEPHHRTPPQPFVASTPKPPVSSTLRPVSKAGPVSSSRAQDASIPTSRPPVSVGLRLGGRTPISRPPALLVRRAADEAQPPASEPAPRSLDPRAREMHVLFEAHNYSSALVLAESVLVSDPSHPEARRCAEGCRAMLGQKYLSRLGGRDNVPRVIMSPEEMRWLSLDHRAGFLLSFVDGSMSVDEVLDVSPMPELEALRILFELRMQGVIEIVEPSRRPGRR